MTHPGNARVLPCSEASERNKAPILAVLKEAFKTTRTVLEIGSGTGQHAVYFARRLPRLLWQPSDRQEVLGDLAERIRREGPDNVRRPLALDVADHPWRVEADGIFSANTLHIMGWPEVAHFFAGVGEVLAAGGVLCVYGPFKYGGTYTTESNARFDRSLRSHAPHMGIRDFERVDELAVAQGLSLQRDHALPANNQLLVWRRNAARPGEARKH